MLRPAAGDEQPERRVFVVPPPTGPPAPVELEGRSRRRRSGPARLILTPVAIACVLALVALTVGVLISDPAAESPVPGLRPATAPTADAAAGAPGDRAADGDAGSGGQGSSEGSEPSTGDGASASSQHLLDTREEQSESVEAAQHSEADPLESTYPAPPVADEPVVAVAERVAPSVVRIETDSTMGQGMGSGIVWDADNGYIVTNHHVVEGIEAVTVRFYDGGDTTGEVVGGSRDHDVAVVRVDPAEADLVAAVFAPTSSVRVGQLAVAIGSPFGLIGTVTAGIVSAVRIHGGGGSDPDFPVPVEMIQTDASINRGNSGGALADWQGRVIGMNTFIQTTSGGSIGLGFAVPSDIVDLIATRVVNGESLDLGYLGISSSGGHADALGVPVTEVVEDSPADEAGLRPGDVILSMDGEPLHNISELAAAVKLRRPGEVVEFDIERDGDRYIATVVLGIWQ